MYVLLLGRPTYGGVVAGTEKGSGGGEVSGTAAHRHNGDRKFAGDIADWMYVPWEYDIIIMPRIVVLGSQY